MTLKMKLAMAATSAKTVKPRVAVASSRHHGSLEATTESELFARASEVATGMEDSSAHYQKLL